jgi:hypothetical protein
MELALDVVASEVALADVTSITLLRPAKGTNGTHSPRVDQLPPYGSMLQAQMAARFTAAAALLGRPVDDVGYFANAMNDAEALALALAARIDLRESPDNSVSLEMGLREGSTRVIRSSSSQGLVSYLGRPARTFPQTRESDHRRSRTPGHRPD